MDWECIHSLASAPFAAVAHAYTTHAHANSIQPQWCTDSTIPIQSDTELFRLTWIRYLSWIQHHDSLSLYIRFFTVFVSYSSPTKCFVLFTILNVVIFAPGHIPKIVCIYGCSKMEILYILYRYTWTPSSLTSCTFVNMHSLDFSTCIFLLLSFPRSSIFFF